MGLADTTIRNLDRRFALIEGLPAIAPYTSPDGKLVLRIVYVPQGNDMMLRTIVAEEAQRTGVQTVVHGLQMSRKGAFYWVLLAERGVISDLGPPGVVYFRDPKHLDFFSDKLEEAHQALRAAIQAEAEGPARFAGRAGRAILHHRYGIE